MDTKASAGLPVPQEVENPSEKGLLPGKAELGIGSPESIKRIVFRLNIIEKTFDQKVGQYVTRRVANIEPELATIIAIVQDLLDTVREFATLTHKSFHAEQGVAPPLKPEINGRETPSPSK